MKHNVYFDGKVQSLGIKVGDQDATVGVIEPGVYDFGEAKRNETIKVIVGKIEVNGYQVSPTDPAVIIRKGNSIRITTTETVVYTCFYD